MQQSRVPRAHCPYSKRSKCVDASTGAYNAMTFLQQKDFQHIFLQPILSLASNSGPAFYKSYHVCAEENASHSTLLIFISV
eukprot:scaffold6710_cov267-Chaetoceros_neogracile.AAC.5